MNRYFTMHPENPQHRLIEQAVELLNKGTLMAYMTDSAYALGCKMNNCSAIQQIKKIRHLADSHPMALICSSISEAAKYARIDDESFHYLKSLTPGPYTFILPAMKTIPRYMHGDRRKSVGIRIPSCPIAIEVVKCLGEPIISSTFWLPEEDSPIIDPHEINTASKKYVNLVLDGGLAPDILTSVVDLRESTPTIIREGAGDVELFK